ncbi:NAD-dependent epimerase/dehydratase family protein [Zobellia galactanivorans]|uniref:NAD(P)-dependent sugar epimerase/dehydratase n=1 Tax=Zobellia galactanivorans (strain DSM 12802 / CCUG 47099 / CIP 106680 / NCIMB 13871 / Dsij) TaxID=63186 RepID=G0LBG3_ZOBGA|nr:GDP-mannose 4,6-dehydratase [Zobellia galactanivorans]CAZ96080.1 NAD(P)-dependent sugar epimerase/dehydratase [Zobellia galactanivorans]
MITEKKKILVTGVAGFLGSNFLVKCLSQGHQVVGIDNLSMGTLDNIEKSLDHQNFHFIKGDVLDKTLIDNLDDDFDVIVHLAAFKIPRYGNAVDTLKINTKGSENMLELARKLKCKFVLASTSDVYGMSPDIPFKEDGNCLIGDSKVPRWAYAVSKLFDEHLALAYMEDYDFPVVILRFFGSYGPNQNLSWWGGPQSVFIDCILKNKEIPIHGDGMQTRTFTFVDDTVAGIYAATMKPEANGEIFNIGANQEITIIELANMLKRISNEPRTPEIKLIPYNEISAGRKYQDVMRRVPDTTKAEKILGIKAQTSLEEGLRITFDWQKNVSKKVVTL